MLFATVTSILVLIVVVVAIARERPHAEPRHAGRPDDAGADPAVGMLVRPSFPLVAHGYDPVAVDAYLDRLEALVAERFADAWQLPVTDAEALRTEAALSVLTSRAGPYPAERSERNDT